MNLTKSAAIYNKFGVPRSVILHCLSALPHYPNVYLDTLSYYKRLVWQNQYILASIKEGTIIRDNKEFIVIFNKPRGQILSKLQDQSSLSFRSARPEFDLPNYVTIY